MARYVAKRLVTSIGLLFLSTILIFLLMRVIPGDPTITKLGGSIKEVDASTLAQIRHELGLDESLPQQYLTWISGVARGDFGSSYFSQFSVTTLIGQRIGATLLLALMSMVIGLAIAVPASVAGAVWPNRYLNGALSGVRRRRDRDPHVRHRDRAHHHPRRRARRAADAGIRLVPARPGRLRPVDAPARAHPRDRRRGGDDADPARLPPRGRLRLVRPHGAGQGAVPLAGGHPARAPERVHSGGHAGGDHRRPPRRRSGDRRVRLRPARGSARCSSTRSSSATTRSCRRSC